MSSKKLLAVAALPLAAHSSLLLASHYSDGLFSLDLADDDGTLAISSQISEGPMMPAWLTYDPDATTAYCPDESFFGSGVFTSYNIGDDGSLAVSGQVSTKGGDLHSALYGGDDGKGFIAAPNYNGGYITTYSIPLTSDSGPLQTLQFTMDGSGPVPDRQDGPHPHSTFTDPTGEYLLSLDLGADLIRIFGINNSTGELTECEAVSTGPGDGPRHGDFASFGGETYLYVVNELGNSMSSWKASYPDSGCLSFSNLQTLSTYPSNVTAPQGSKAAEVHVKAEFVYVANRNDQSFGEGMDSIAVYSIESDSGKASFQQLANAHAYFPRTFAINEAGDLVAVGGQTSANVAILGRDKTTGMIGELVASLDVGQPGTVNNEDGLSAVIWIE